MNCKQVQDGNVIEGYLAGTLTPEVQEAWEEHYFECAECTRRLETWQAVEGALREAAPQIRQEMKPRRTWTWAVGIAAAVVVAVGAGLVMRTAVVPAAPEEHPAVLTARLEPPVYAEPVMRGVESPAEVRFREAMRSYQQRDWAGAIAGLRAAVDLDGNAAASRFFLGASYLLAGQAADGVRELEPLAAGASPFAEEARFVLAHGYLMLGRKADAVMALRQVASGGGDFAARATALIKEIGDR